MLGALFILGLVGIATAAVSAGYVRACLREEDPSYEQGRPSWQFSLLWGAVKPFRDVVHFRNWRRSRGAPAAVTYVYFVSVAIACLAALGFLFLAFEAVARVKLPGS